MALMKYLLQGIEDGVVINKKITRDFLYSAEKQKIPHEQLHEYITVFLNSEDVKDKALSTRKSYSSFLRKWVRYVYLRENIPVPMQLMNQKQRTEVEKTSEPEITYTPPTPEKDIDDEYLEFLKRYEEVTQ